MKAINLIIFALLFLTAANVSVKAESYSQRNASQAQRGPSGANAHLWVSHADAEKMIQLYAYANQAWAIEQSCNFLSEEDKQTFHTKLETYGNFVKYTFRQYYEKVISLLHRSNIIGAEAVSRFGCDKRNEEAVMESLSNVLELNEILQLDPTQIPQSQGY